MAGLLSPKPVYHPQGNGQYSSYARGLSNFSETPPLSAPSAQGHHMPPGGYATPNLAHGAIGLPEDGKIYSLVIELLDPGTREGALLELSKKREQYDDLALVLWHSFGEYSNSVCALAQAYLRSNKVLCPHSYKRLFLYILFFLLQTLPPMYPTVFVMRWPSSNAWHRIQRLVNYFSMVIHHDFSPIVY